jgi:hypothetical protein
VAIVRQRHREEIGHRRRLLHLLSLAQDHAAPGRGNALVEKTCA